MTEVAEVFAGDSYEIVAWGRGQDVLLFEQFGSYQGEWLLAAVAPDGTYYFYKDYYGSCSGCDAFQSDEPAGERDSEKVQNFIKDYPPFIEVPQGTMQHIAVQGWDRLLEILPANIREVAGQVDEFVRDVTTRILVREKLPLTPALILATRNMEIRREAMEAFGVERFADEAGFKWLDRDGEDALGEVPGATTPKRYLYLKDSSGPRRYLLQVPPDTSTVLAGKAWSFGLAPDAYRPLAET